jgi:hypothetical protein
MRRKIDLIYCGVGNQKLDMYATQVGLLYGMRLPKDKRRGASLPVYFADQDWKKPNLEEYKKSVIDDSPAVCTIIDWERPDQEKEVWR